MNVHPNVLDKRLQAGQFTGTIDQNNGNIECATAERPRFAIALEPAFRREQLEQTPGPGQRQSGLYLHHARFSRYSVQAGRFGRMRVRKRPALEYLDDSGGAFPW
jgi:hypothetical protein